MSIRMFLLLSVILSSPISIVFADDADDLAEEIRESAISLCDSSGFSTDLPEWVMDIKNYFDGRTDLCRELYDYDESVEEIFERNKVPKRFRASLPLLKKMMSSDNDNDWMTCMAEAQFEPCQEILRNYKVSIDTFAHIFAYCERGVDCTKNWFKNNKPPYKLPYLTEEQLREGLSTDERLAKKARDERNKGKQQPARVSEAEKETDKSTSRVQLSLDELMAKNDRDELNKEKQPQVPVDKDRESTDQGGKKVRLSLDELINRREENTPVASQDQAVKPSIGFGNIKEGRAAMRVAKKKQELAELNDQIMNVCSCVVTGAACFSAPRSSEQNVANAMQETMANFSKEKSKACNDWERTYLNRPDEKMESLQSAILMAGEYLSGLKQYDTQFVDAIQQLQLKEKEIQVARAEYQRKQEQAKKKEGGFQWGKLAALGTGAVIGGIGNLDSQTQVDAITGMIKDSMQGSTGMANTSAALEQRAAEINLASQAIAPAQATATTQEPHQEQYPITCSTTKMTSTIPLAYFTQGCRTAMIDFAQAYSCNEIDRFAQVKNNCLDACGHPQCLEKPN